MLPLLLFAAFAADVTTATPDLVGAALAPGVRVSGAATDEQLATVRGLLDAAASCTGRPNPTATLRVAQGTGGSGVESTLLAEVSPPTVLISRAPSKASLAFSVAQLWFPDDGTALAAGRAEVLARCSVKGEPADQPTGVWTTGMTDLRTWTSEGATSDDERRRQVNAARALVAAISDVLGAGTVLGPDGASWARLIELLRAKGGVSAQIADRVEAGAEGQAWLLRNTDGDALITFYELVAGTDPEQWDTDHDGRWDGGPAAWPAGAVPVVQDGVATCLPGLLGMDEIGSMILHVQTISGGERPEPIPLSVGETAQRPAMDVQASGVADGRWHVGWLTRGEGTWRDNDRCVQDDRATIFTLSRDLTPMLAPVLAALPAARAEAEAKLGRTITGRFEVALGESDTSLNIDRSHEDVGTLRIDKERASALMHRKAWMDLARVIIAAQVADASGAELRERPPALEAFTRWLFPTIKGGAWFVDYPADAKPWSDRVKTCATGWLGYLDRSCD